jgi:hypothetical protein
VIWKVIYGGLAGINTINAVAEFRIGHYGWMAFDLALAVWMAYFFITCDRRFGR